MERISPPTSRILEKAAHFGSSPRRRAARSKQGLRSSRGPRRQGGRPGATRRSRVTEGLPTRFGHRCVRRDDRLRASPAAARRASLVDGALPRAPVYASPRDEHSAKDGGVSYSFSTHGLPLAD